MSVQSFSVTSWIAIIALYTLIFLIASVGNICVIAVCYNSLKQKPSSLHWYIGNLALTDLLFMWITVLDIIYFVSDRWIGGNISCKVQSFLLETTYAASILTLVRISRERLKVITKPLLTHTVPFSTKDTLMRIFLLWFVATSLCSPLLFAYSIKQDKDGIKVCNSEKTWPDIARQLYYLLRAFFLFGCSLLFMIWAHHKIFRSLGTIIVPVISQQCITKCRQRKVSKMLAVVTGPFFALWMPFIVIRTLLYFHVTENQTVFRFSQLLVCIGAAVNPFIYGIYSNEFRNCLRGIVRCNGKWRMHNQSRVVVKPIRLSKPNKKF